MRPAPEGGGSCCWELQRLSVGGVPVVYEQERQEASAQSSLSPVTATTDKLPSCSTHAPQES